MSDVLTPWPNTRGLDELEHWEAQIIQPDGIPGDMLKIDSEMMGKLNWGRGESPLGLTLTVNGPIPELAEGQSVEVRYCFDGVVYRFPTMSPQGVSELYDVGEWFDLSLIDHTSDFAADGIDFPMVFEAGSVIMAKAGEVLRLSKPSQVFVLPELDLTLRNLMSFGTSTDPLLIFNKLMEAAGCNKLEPGSGSTLQVQQWTPANERPVQMEFGPDQAGYVPEVRVQSDYLGTPNVAHYEAPGSASSNSLTGRWRDEDLRSPWSIQRRKKRIFARPGKGEAANQQIADMHARRIGTDSEGRGRVATIRGAFQPLKPRDIIRTTHPDHEKLNGNWEVMTCSVDTSLGSDTTWVVKEVTS